MQLLHPLRHLSRPMLAIGLLLGAFGGRTPVLAADSAIGFAPDAVAVGPGDTFSVDVVVNLAQEIRGLQFGMKFDPSVVQVSSVTEGPYLKDWARAHQAQSAMAIPFQVDNSRGEVSIGGLLLLGGDSNGGPAGPGVVATVKGIVRPDASASSALTLTAVKFASTLPDASAVPNIAVIAGGVAVGGAPMPAADPSGGVAPPPSGAAVQSEGSTVVPPASDSGPDGFVDTTASTSTEAADAASALSGPVWHDVFMQADGTELPPIVVPTSAPVFSSDVNRESATVAAAATATALSRAVVAVTPPALQQPQSPSGALNPTPRPAPATPATAQPDRRAPTPTPIPRTANSALRPVGSSGVFLPWELIAGVGGGVVAAGLILVGFRRAPTNPSV